MIRWPDWFTDGVIRFLRFTDLLEPMERLVEWLARHLPARGEK